MEYTIKICMKSNTRKLTEEQINELKNSILNYLLHDYDNLFEPSYNLDSNDEEYEVAPIELEVI